MIDENWDVGSLWNPGDSDLPQPMRNVLEILDTMDGMVKMSIPVTSGTPPSNNEAAALAATDGLTTKVMLANYHHHRTSSTPTDYRVRLTDLGPGDYQVTETRIDKDHGNYRTQWLVDSASFTRQGDNSQYDLYPLAGLNDPAALALWNANYAGYQVLANDMDMGSAIHVVDDSGILEIVVQLPAHAVSFFDIVSAVLTNPDPCAFGGDSTCNTDDLDALYAVLNTTVPPTNPLFDLNADNVINMADLDQWLSLAATENGFDSAYLRGDTGLDRDVDLSDYNALASHFDPGGVYGPYWWQDGNFDGDVDLGDYNWLASNFVPNGYGQAAVPEPASALLALLATLLTSAPGRRSKNGCDHRCTSL